MCPTIDEWIMKICLIYIVKCPAATQNYEIGQFTATCIGPKDFILSEMSQKNEKQGKSHLMSI